LKLGGRDPAQIISGPKKGLVTGKSFIANINGIEI